MQREEIEWSQFYWADCNNCRLKRVLLIGDSIVVGSREYVVEKLRGKMGVAAFATSKIVGDPAFCRELMLAFADYPIDFVYFNNGLHGLNYDDDFFRRGLESLVDLLELSGHTQLCWRHSTPISEKNHPEKTGELNQVVIRRNRIAETLMKSRNIPVDDLYHPMLEHPELRVNDGFHYTAEGCRFIGTHVADTIASLWC